MIKLHIVREAYDAGQIDFNYMLTANIPLDGLTKLLPCQEYNHKSAMIDGSSPMIMEGKFLK